MSVFTPQLLQSGATQVIHGDICGGTYTLFLFIGLSFFIFSSTLIY